MPRSKTYHAYKQYSNLSDRELAMRLDAWLKSQPPKVQEKVNLHVKNLKGSLYDVGEFGAKASVMRIYLEVLEMK